MGIQGLEKGPGERPPHNNQTAVPETMYVQHGLSRGQPLNRRFIKRTIDALNRRRPIPQAQQVIPANPGSQLVPIFIRWAVAGIADTASLAVELGIDVTDPLILFLDAELAATSGEAFLFCYGKDDTDQPALQDPLIVYPWYRHLIEYFKDPDDNQIFDPFDADNPAQAHLAARLGDRLVLMTGMGTALGPAPTVDTLCTVTEDPPG